jgi:hypothetical protein
MTVALSETCRVGRYVTIYTANRVRDPRSARDERDPFLLTRALHLPTGDATCSDLSTRFATAAMSDSTYLCADQWEVDLIVR